MLRRTSALPKLAAAAVALALLAPGAASALPAVPATDVPLLGQSGSTAPAPAQTRGPQGRIVGGTVIAITDAPWQVRLVGTSFTCGGSILGANLVLTAAHCVEGVAPSSLQVVAGRSNADVAVPATEQLRPVTDIAIHPDYTEAGPVDTTADLALVTFALPLTFTGPAVQPIALPAPWTPVTSMAPVPTDLRVTGYGITVDGGQSTDGLLRSVATTVSDPELCSAHAENAIAICARSPLGSSCQGDSGGPLVTNGPNPVQVGVVSNGASCGPTTDDFYVNLLAPENRAFIDNGFGPNRGAPTPLAPRGLTEPSMTGPASFRAGDTVTCNAGTFANAPTEVRIEFSKEDGTVLQSSVGSTAQLTLPAAAVGSRLTCRPFATNAGGTFVGLRFTTSATVGAAPVAPATPSAPVAGAPGSCPSSLDAAARFPLKIKAPASARRGKSITLRVSRLGPPTAAHGVVVGITGPKKFLITGSAAFPSNGQAARESDLQEFVKIRMRVPRTLKVGQRYSFRATMLVAGSVDEIAEERVCEYGSKAFSLRIRR